MVNSLIDITNAVPRITEFQFSHPINLSFKKGERWAFLGPNGSGKTLLAKIIKGEYALQTGKITYHFREDKPAYQQIKHLSFHGIYGLADVRSVYYQQRWHSTENELISVEEILLKSGKKEDVNELISLFEVQDMLKKSIILLSSGELRKFLIIQAFISKPEVLIIDNPFIGLDEKSRIIFSRLLKELSENFRVLLILLIADPSDIPDWCETILPVGYGKNIGHPISLSEYKSEKTTEKTLFPTKISASTQWIANPYAENTDFSGAVLDMQNVCIQYNNRIILKNIDWKIQKGEKWALSGPNGSGKSTLLSLIYADNPQAYANHFYLFGRKRGSGESIWDIKKRIGFVSPEFHLYYKRDISCQEVIASGFYDYIGIYPIRKKEYLSIALEWLKLVQLENLKNKSFLRISFGEQRLLMLLRAFVKNPDLLILDEPLHGLDKTNKELALFLVSKYCEQKNKSLIYVTHYINEISNSIRQQLCLERK
ncbi:MAG: ATP-binding cassette domain-containing protein [Dysgonamonadaceae bacterium]|jgi:molybdate transport system ATP-binding protein|nr:ATP-binding cassette domain-containing protein [Dysgonamonadaceae bacterium]